MKKDHKIIKYNIFRAKIQAASSLLLLLVVLFGGPYFIRTIEFQPEKTISIIAVIVLLLVSGIAFYSNIAAIKKYKAFLE